MTTITAKPTIITTPTGIAYRRQVITDSWGRQRVCDKRLSDLPKPHAEACECCGQSIAGDRSTKRFCSDACKMKAYRQRRQAKG